MIRRYLITAFTLFNAMQLVSYAQSDTLTIKAIAEKVGKAPTEHIYLQLNKPRYERGDTIWFRLYNVTNGHKLSAISHTAYAELVGLNDTVIQKLNLKLSSGMANAEFILPVILNPGKYRIRAYTNWMKNNGEQYFYDRQVVIGGIAPAAANAVNTKMAVKNASTPSDEQDVQFFPESGSLVNGLRSRVAFKAMNADGTAASISGSIESLDGKTVAAVESGHEGMGVFALMPLEGERYEAILKFANGRIATIPLPEPIAEGFVLSVNNREPDTVTVRIAANALLLKNKAGDGFYLVAQSGGKVCFTTTGNLNAPVYQVKIPKNRFPTGVARLTLFSSTGEPLNERVVFIQRSDNLVLNVNAAKNTYSPAEKINLSLSAGTNAQQPVVGSFSAAVINESLVPVDEAGEATIFSQLLLNSELHGRIADPGYYLAKDNENTQTDLDLLMLTQGFRKLEWKKLLDTVHKAPQFFAEDGLSLSGMVKADNKKPVAGGKVRVLALQKLISIDTVTDNYGRFTIAGLDIAGKTPLSLKATDSKNSNEVTVTLDQPELKVSPAPVYLASTAAQTVALEKSYQENKRILDQYNSNQLKEVKIRGEVAQKNKPDLTGSSNRNGPGHADEVIMGKDMEEMGCPFVVDCLAIKIPFVDEKNGQLYTYSRGMQTKFAGPIPMTVFINGSIGSLDNITVDEIYSVEVMTSNQYKAIYGHDAAGGLILITTKHGIPGNEKIKDKVPGALNFLFTGYYKARTFYTPKYNTPDDIAKQAQRTAVYWQPDVITDKDGKATIDYINAGKGNYRVVIEGIDNDGRLGRQVFRYTVQ